MADSSSPHPPGSDDVSDAISELTSDLFAEYNLLNLNEYLKLFEEIAEPTRFAVCYLLRTEGVKSAKELGTALNRSENALHYHLDRLVESGLVENRRRQRPDDEGFYSYYELTGLGADLIDAVTDFIRTEKIALEEYYTDRQNV